MFKGLLRQVVPKPQPTRRAGRLCVACNKLVGMEDTHCPHCGVAQTGARKAAKAALSVIPADLSATHFIMGVLVLLFLVPLLALGGNPDFDAGKYLGSGDTLAAIYMGAVIKVRGHALEYWRIVTASYVHFGVMHIGFNCYALLILGRLTEQLYGRGWFVFLYVSTGIVAFVVSYLGHDYNTITAGASGSIFGLIGVGIAHCWRHRWANRMLLRTLIMWAVISAVFGLFIGADNWAHGGGFVAGVGLAWVFKAEAVTRGRAMQRIGDRLGMASAAVVLISFGFAIASAAN